MIALRLLCALILFPAAAATQDPVRGQLFGETESLMQAARERKADLYAPGSFGRARESFAAAEADYRAGRNLDQIRGRLRDTETALRQALETTKLAEITFRALMAARNDAVSADAPRSTPELWREGEARFRKAAAELEDGDIKDAREAAQEAEDTYRRAELEAITSNYLAPARELLARAERTDVRDNAPKTLELAETMATDAERILSQNRYDTDEARQRAQDAMYEATHALYLHRTIEEMLERKMRFEDVFLLAEEPLRRIAGALNVPARFDAGFEAVTGAVTARVAEMEQSLAEARQTAQQQQMEIANLREQIASMENRLGTLTAAEQQLKDDLARRKAREETFVRVSGLLSPEEGVVTRDGNSLVVRLHGLVFPPGGSAVLAEHAALLEKVREAIARFPESQVIVEGHTDSQGGDEANMVLSEQRAGAVAEYLRSGAAAGTKIVHFGYGETRPIAGNETPEGRARNRRIDVVIVPAWAVAGGH
ncbi:MAG: OmpA family protein [Bacteroidota bacterium]